MDTVDRDPSAARSDRPVREDTSRSGRETTSRSGREATSRSGREAGATRTFPVPSSGRVFRSRRTVRLGEADPNGRLRLDAIARYLQDVATDDSADARDRDTEAWVVRRTLVEQRGAARLDEEVELATFCSGMGSRWAERSTALESASGSISTATVWVHLDGSTGRPKALPASFRTIYGLEVDGVMSGREIAARQLHDPLALDGDDVQSAPWWPRVTDLDVLDHVNNAVAWEVVEQVLARSAARGLVSIDPSGPLRVEVEFRDPIDRTVVDAAVPLTIAHRIFDGAVQITLWSSDAATVHLTAEVRVLV